MKQMVKNWKALEELGDNPKEIMKEVTTEIIENGEVVESMNGYSMEIYNISGFTFEDIYTSAVKNGNKLTIVTSFNLTRTADVSGSQNLLKIRCPQEVMNKLIPTSIGTYSALDFKLLYAINSNNGSLPYKIIVRKESSTNSIIFTLFGDSIPTFTLNTKFFCRVEETFLLSDELPIS